MNKWPMVRLGDVCEEITTENPTKYNKLIDYIDISSVNVETKEIIGHKTILSMEAPSRARQKVYVGDVLVSTVRPNLNAVAIIKRHDNDIIASTGFSVLRAKNNLALNRYIFEFTKTSGFIAELIKQATGANYPAVSSKIILNQKIPLPPLPIQQKIADILDRANALIEKRKLQIKKLDLLVKSQFIEMFGDPVMNDKGWERGTIRDIVTQVNYGTSKPANEGGRYPYLRMNNITYDGQLDLTDLKYIDIADNEIEKFIAKKNDVLFNRTNSKELVGKTCVFNIDERMIIAGYIIRVRLNERAIPVYLSAVLNADFGKLTLRTMCKTIIGQANINAQELQNIEILIPPVNLQNRFADFVHTADKSKFELKRSLDELGVLYKALLQENFD